MSISIGIPDQYDHPDFEEMLRFVIRTCGARNIPVAVHLQSVELSTKWIQEGVRFILHKTDVGALHEGFRRDFRSTSTSWRRNLWANDRKGQKIRRGYLTERTWSGESERHGEIRSIRQSSLDWRV